MYIAPTILLPLSSDEIISYSINFFKLESSNLKTYFCSGSLYEVFWSNLLNCKKALLLFLTGNSTLLKFLFLPARITTVLSCIIISQLPLPYNDMSPGSANTPFISFIPFKSLNFLFLETVNI